MSAEFLRTILDYNSWANIRVFERAAAVTKSEYFEAAPGLSFANLHATLVHIVVAELVWLARWQGGLPAEALKDARQADRLAETEIQTFNAVETLWRQGKEIYIVYPNGVEGSKLTCKKIENAIGVEGTMRDWKTLKKFK